MVLHSKLKQDVDLQNLPSNKWTTWRGFSRLDLISHSNEVSPIILSLKLNIDELFSAMISLVKNDLASSDFDKSLLISACCVNEHKDYARLALKILSVKNACWSKKENVYAVHIAANFLQPDILSLILDAEYDVNMVTRNNESPLILAVVVDKCTLQNIPWACNKDLCDPNKTFDEVLEERRMQTLTLLVQKGADVNIHPTKLPSALAVSCQKGNKEIVQFLLRSGANVNETGNKLSALHLASMEGNLEIVQLLLDKGADVNMRSKYGFTPLYLASRKGNSAIVEILLTRGTNDELKERTAYNPFFAACAHGHINIVQMFLQHKPYINCSMTNDTSAILAAVGNGHAKVVDLLLKTGADVNSFQKKKVMSPILFDVIAHGHELVLKLLVTCGVNLSIVTRETDDSDTPLIIASQNGHYSTVQFLLENGANVTETNRLKISPLHFAAENGHLEIVQLLLKNNAGVNSCSKRESSPLIRASYRGHNDIVKELLNQGADVNLANKKMATPLFLASKYGHAQAAKTLLAHKADFNLCTKSGCSPLFVAARFGHREVVKDLLCHGAKINENDSKNPLLNSAFHGYYKITELLIDNGVKINVQDKEGSTPLINAAMEGWTDIVKLLLKRGADVNKCDEDGEDALHWASLMGYADIVKLFIEHGMDINNYDEDTYSPFEKAVGGNHLSLALLLLEHGADVNAIVYGKTVLYLVCNAGFKDVVDDLLGVTQRSILKKKMILLRLTALCCRVGWSYRNSRRTPTSWCRCKLYSMIQGYHGADVNAKSKSENTALHASSYDSSKLESMLTLLKNKADVNARNKDGATPMMLALHISNLTKERVQALIDYGAGVNMRDNSGQSALHFAATCNDKHDVVSLLLEHGADVNARNDEGETALHEACYPDFLKTITVLLRHGADVNIRSNANLTPLDIAKEEGYTKVIRILSKKINECRVEEASSSNSGMSNVSDSGNIVVRTRSNPLGSVLPMRKIVKLKKTWRI
ncbi:ankyrin-3-like [Saccostrea cucullata]|uniref:ankyrin-3-like n=1 Tax=Saccostrea cuccullata TaxID=36930 RepID=UPI002ED5B073